MILEPLNVGLGVRQMRVRLWIGLFEMTSESEATEGLIRVDSIHFGGEAAWVSRRRREHAYFSPAMASAMFWE